MGLAVRLCESLFHFCQYHIGFVTLPENMTVINAVPAGTDIKFYNIKLSCNAVDNALEGCLLYLSCSLFLRRILFCSVRVVFLAAGSPLTSPELSVPITNVL